MNFRKRVYLKDHGLLYAKLNTILLHVTYSKHSHNYNKHKKTHIIQIFYCIIFKKGVELTKSIRQVCFKHEDFFKNLKINERIKMSEAMLFHM